MDRFRRPRGECTRTHRVMFYLFYLFPIIDGFFIELPQPLDTLPGLYISGASLPIETTVLDFCGIEGTYVSINNTECLESFYPSYRFIIEDSQGRRVDSRLGSGILPTLFLRKSLPWHKEIILERTLLYNEEQVDEYLSVSTFDCPLYSGQLIGNLPQLSGYVPKEPEIPVLDIDLESLCETNLTLNVTKCPEVLFELQHSEVKESVGFKFIKPKFKIDKDLQVCAISSGVCYANSLPNWSSGKCFVIGSEKRQEIQYLVPNQWRFISAISQQILENVDTLLGVSPLYKFYYTTSSTTIKERRKRFFQIIDEIIAWAINARTFHVLAKFDNQLTAGFRAADENIEKIKYNYDVMAGNTATLKQHIIGDIQFQLQSFLAFKESFKFIASDASSAGLKVIKIQDWCLNNFGQHYKMKTDIFEFTNRTPTEEITFADKKVYSFTTCPNVERTPKTLNGTFDYHNGTSVQLVENPVITIQMCGVICSVGILPNFSLNFDQAVEICERNGSKSFFYNEQMCSSDYSYALPLNRRQTITVGLERIPDDYKYISPQFKSAAEAYLSARPKLQSLYKAVEKISQGILDAVKIVTAIPIAIARLAVAIIGGLLQLAFGIFFGQYIPVIIFGLIILLNFLMNLYLLKTHK